MPRAPYSQDEPASLALDAFGHRDYADTLVGMVTDDFPPGTVGVFGPWGVGKSTIIGGLQEALDSTDGVAFAYFDAWRYEGDSLRRQFLVEVAGQLDNARDLNRCKFSVEKDLKDLDVDVQVPQDTVKLFSPPHLIRAGVIGLVLAVATLLLAWLGVFGGIASSGDLGKKALVGIAAVGFGFVLSLLSQSVVINTTSVTKRSLQDPDRFGEKFTDVLEALKPKRVVIAIDNLDRCSPERAVSMLSTIKTYLEPAASRGPDRPRSSAIPAAKQKEVLFVIAVDDEALRRHLVAQEVERSAHDGDLAVADRYVDEYLAKFFNARLRVREIIPDDWRGYIDAHLQPMIQARGITDAHARELVGLVSAGLRHNPRRVKQFVNDLESNLRLLEERETAKDGKSPGIAPPLSIHVSMVAKLALLESEWPNAYVRISKEPRLLAFWEEKTEQPEDFDWTTAMPGSAQDGEESSATSIDPERRREFIAFLRSARRVEVPYLRALLRLKQSQEEVKLPGVLEFREAVVNGATNDAAAVLDSASTDDSTGLIKRLPAFLDEEIREQFWDGALAVVNATVTLEAARSHDDVRVEVLEAAATNPTVCSELKNLNPAAVLGNVSQLPRASRPKILAPFVARAADSESGDSARASAIAAIVPAAGYLSPAQKITLRTAIAGDLAGKFEIYADLVEALPGTLPVEAGKAAVEALNTPTDERHSLDSNPDALRVAVVALKEHPSDGDLERAAVECMSNALSGSTPDSDQYKDELAQATKLVEVAAGSAPDEWAGLANQVVERWDQYPVEHRLSVVTFLNGVLDHATEESQNSVPQDVATRAFSQPDQGFELDEALGTPRPSHFEEAFKSATRNTAVSVPGMMKRAWGALFGSSKPSQDSLQELLTDAVAAGQFENADSLLAEGADQLGSMAQETADPMAEQLRTAISGQTPVPTRLLALIGESASPEVGRQLATALSEQIAESWDEATRMIDEMSDSAPMLRREVTTAVAQGLLSEAQVGPADDARLKAAASGIADLDKDLQEQLTQKFAQWLRAQHDQVALLAGHIGAFQGLAAGTRNSLVETMIEIEQAIADESDRRALLTAAVAIRGSNASRATRALKDRAAELEDGEGFDGELGKELRSLLP